MPYIGNTIRAADDYRLIDDISSGFNGSETSFALQVAGSAPVPFPKSPQQVLISVNGVIQEPDPTGASGFNLVGTNIVFSSAPTNGHAFFGIIYATADYLNAGGNFPAGSLGAPSITFIGDENTGLFRKSGGSVGFVSDATEIANFDSNGITISSGNIIIPDSIIHNGDTNTKIRFPAADTISTETGGSERLRINSSGNVGINETSPSQKLHVGGDIQVGFATPNDAARQLNFNANRGSAGDTLANINWQWNDKFVAQIRGIAGNDTTNKDDAALGFFTSAANSLVERLRIQRDGNIGAGTSDPKTKFHIQQSAVSNAPNRSSALYLENNANCELQFVGNSSNDCQLRFGTSNNSFLGAIEYELDNANMEFYTGGSERLRIDSSGKVGIGTTSPTNQLHIYDSATANDTPELKIESFRPSIRLKDRSSSSVSAEIVGDNSLKFSVSTPVDDSTALTERMRIDSSGRLLLGTTTGASTDSGQGGTLTIANTNPGITLRSGTSNVGSIYFSDGTSGSDELRGLIQYNHSSNFLRFFTDAGERMRIDSSGRVLIGTSSGTGHSLTGTNNPLLQVESASSNDYARASFIFNGATSVGPGLWFGKSRGTSVGSNTIVNDGDQVGGFFFHAADGTDKFSRVAAIEVKVDGTPGSNDTPGRITFATTPDGADGTTERMRINSDGTVAIGPNTDGHALLTLSQSASAHLDALAIQQGNTGSGSGDGLFIGIDSNADAFIFHKENRNIEFGTNNSERMRISGGGDVSIGISTAARTPLHIHEPSSNTTNVHLTNTDSGTTSQDGLTIFMDGNSSAGMWYREAGSLRFASNNTERMRIHSAGEVSIQTTSINLQGGGASDFMLTLLANTGSNHNGMMVSGVANQHAAYTTRPSANHLYFAGFFLNNAGSGVGNIEVGLSGTSFHTSSDYRLKENVTNISDGITRLKQLLPRRFNWIIDETNTLQDGFLAHEVSSIVPEAISGEKDAVATEDGGQYAKGDPIYQQIDHSKLVPLLVAALQEEIAKRESLETRIAALESA